MVFPQDCHVIPTYFSNHVLWYLLQMIVETFLCANCDVYILCTFKVSRMSIALMRRTAEPKIGPVAAIFM